MSALNELQHAFQAYVLDGNGAVVEHIAAPGSADPERRLAIYYDAYRLRLLEALSEDFPALRALAGDQEFNRLARAYIAAYPSPHFNLRWYGAGLAGFLRETRPFAARTVLADMAQFEWALTLAFDAADVAPLAPGALSTVAPDAWPALRFDFHPSLQRVDLAWDVTAFWQQVDAPEPPQPPARLPASKPWLVWRRQLSVYFRALDNDEAAMLDRARSGDTFAQLCEALCAQVEPAQVPARAAALLQRWLGEESIAGLRTA